ncbi:type II toxin-antitoxin system RelE/ParE family toxin [Aureibaculum sp. 2210JD6-5]|uniref:type II toxin-antitoxin system RelE/ParE family toxin n=1 Tax=Aureibaculum sp. 2210JD6-5 TaxID=3103957 RepID=UPI002AAC86A8|nr:type II toxin-antitoxin system RelE/ParE family toxin [Aureibaculum sp. 2210JD6-5]MDY7396883.1 type II toxin-antitoxin system RelE/ParE family toxin [Aureibaculum sp. 2210JD6-5]
MKYILTEQTKLDLINIHQFGVYRFGETQADKYFYAFFEQFEIISKNPYLFPKVDFIKKGYRRCVCGSDSIYYLIHNDVIEIMAIIGRQDINKKLKA